MVLLSRSFICINSKEKRTDIRIFWLASFVRVRGGGGASERLFYHVVKKGFTLPHSQLFVALIHDFGHQSYKLHPLYCCRVQIEVGRHCLHLQGRILYALKCAICSTLLCVRVPLPYPIQSHQSGLQRRVRKRLLSSLRPLSWRRDLLKYGTRAARRCWGPLVAQKLPNFLTF